VLSLFFIGGLKVIMPELPLAAVDRLIRKSGAGRVSEDAVAALTEILEEDAINLAKVAAKFAEHAKRKTVTAEDVKLAHKQKGNNS